MTDTSRNAAPEQIWANPEASGPCAGWGFEGWWHVDETCGEVSYTHTDLYAAAIARAETAEALVRKEALQALASLDQAREAYAAQVQAEAERDALRAEVDMLRAALTWVEMVTSTGDGLTPHATGVVNQLVRRELEASK